MNDSKQTFNFLPAPWWTNDNEPIHPSYSVITKFGQVELDMTMTHVIHVEPHALYLKWRGVEYHFSCNILRHQGPDGYYWKKQAMELRRKGGGQINQELFDAMHDLLNEIVSRVDSLFSEGAKRHIEMCDIYYQWLSAKKVADAKMKELAEFADKWPAIVRPALRDIIKED
jgi:hypothetical protein